MKESELVLTHVLNCDRLSLHLNKDKLLNKEKLSQVSEILKRRINGEPLQYILGECEFMGFKFKIDKRALIPRQETEILVEQAIAALRAMGKATPRILDLCTGSGCIAISIARILPQAKVSASDISKEALELAKENVCLNKTNVKFLQSDLFSNIGGKFDLIVSNPPYVALAQIDKLSKEISFEPKKALEAGIDGLDFYRFIIKDALKHLNKDGLLIFEVGIDQASLIRDLLIREKFSDIKIVRDYNNIDRVVLARRPWIN